MKKYNKFYLVCGLAMAVSEVWKQLCLTFIVNNGHYYWWYFPFQLCSIPMYICLVLPWIKPGPVRRALLCFLMDFGLLAGIFTFFDTRGLHYTYAPLTVHSFAWHILLIVLGLMSGWSRESDYSWKGYQGSVAVYGGGCVIATICNIVFYQYGTINMFFISPRYLMRQMVFRDIAQVLGNTAGIVIYIAAIISGAGIVHGIWHLMAGRNQKE